MTVAIQEGEQRNLLSSISCIRSPWIDQIIAEEKNIIRLHVDYKSNKKPRIEGRNR
jgi:hypothetical protein